MVGREVLKQRRKIKTQSKSAGENGPLILLGLFPRSPHLFPGVGNMVKKRKKAPARTNRSRGTGKDRLQVNPALGASRNATIYE